MRIARRIKWRFGPLAAADRVGINQPFIFAEMMPMPDTDPSPNPVLAEVWRGSVLECIHRGTAVVCRPNGEVVGVRSRTADSQVMLFRTVWLTRSPHKVVTR